MGCASGISQWPNNSIAGDVVKIKWVIKSFAGLGNVAASKDINQMQMPPFVIICWISTVGQGDFIHKPNV